MAKLLTAFVIIVVSVAATSTLLAQDYNRGIDAYDLGDYATALKIWTPLAEQGDAKAQLNLGFMYEKGQGVVQDYAESVKWYRKAAEQGRADAQTNLGFMYDEGPGVPQHSAEAVKWLRKAAEQGVAQAQNNLGLMYAQGMGVVQDTMAAHMWFNIAAANGHEDALKNRDIAAHKLSSSQLAEAQQKAKRCMASGYKDCD
jgi:TPR repeat protein